MNWTRQQLKTNAKLMLRGNYWLCVVVTFVVGLMAGGNTEISWKNSSDTYENGSQMISNIFGGEWVNYVVTILPFLASIMIVLVIVAVIVKIFIGNALKVGRARFYLHNIHSKGELNDLAFGFQNQFMNVVKVLFMRDLYVFLWSLLLIVPGIIKAFEYRQVEYLMADNPELSVDEALQTSKEMMLGEKMNTFVLDLSFILWNILSSITFGLVGIFWVNPWMDATHAELYTAIKTRYQSSNTYTEV